jgi:cytochrome P450
MTSTPPTTETMSAQEAGLTLLDPGAYADGRMEQACAVLRRESPVHRVEAPEFEPFWALAKHEDIWRAEREPELFVTKPRYRLFRTAQEPAPGSPRTLVSMDPPKHTEYRGLFARRFRRQSLRAIEDQVRGLARAAVDGMAARGDAYDFVAEVSMQYPLTVICSMIGIPERDRALILRMTQQSFGSEDPEYRAAAQAEAAADWDLPPYVLATMADRRDSPADDLATVLAHSRIGGEPMPAPELIGYFAILATAGHDTTSSAISGGLRALIENPDQLERLRRDPSLMPTAVDEMIRWATPVNSFMRVATADTEIRGQRIAAGDAVLLMYPSANRDEDVFDQPYRFDVGRAPNRHLAFGQGIHYCLGTHLAKLETEIFYAELIPRLREIEIIGQPELVKTLFVGGLKHLPIRASVVMGQAA